tara:strand:+ start:1475 stop:2992 length:1518 start_codon:yes stop_codon:yes gene_type:complete
MRSESVIFWHRNDLRMSDNIGLSYAARENDSLIGLYIIDPKRFNSSNVSNAKKWFILESLKELKLNWQNSGSELLIIKGNPYEILPNLCKSINSKLIIWNKDIDPFFRKQDKILIRILKENNLRSIDFWDHLIIDPGEIKTKSETNYKVYTPFSISWKRKLENNYPEGFSIISKPSYLKRVETMRIKKENLIFWEKLNIIKNLNELDWSFEGYSLCPCIPGEKAAQIQLSKFSQKSSLQKLNSPAMVNGSIYTYAKNRDFPSIQGTSFLSAALASGTISPRVIINEIINSRIISLNANKDRSLKSTITWEKEIIWREFYHHALFAFPELAKGPFRSKWINFPWQNNSSYFDSWAHGFTGFPIIDAAMRQLNASGWMHNRCRMIVASFLVKDLICDWRLGESLFMSKLVDGDIASNNGGWQWSASSGMDSKPLRIFNPYTQTKRFDPQAIYIKYWLPELKHINNHDLISGDISSIERRGYPCPIVDHNKQQSKFKKIYATLPISIQ